MRTVKFKSSEVGPIPVEWDVVCLGQMIQDRRAQLQTGPFGTVLSASEFVDSGHPVISVREIRTGYIKLFDETPCVNDETYKELKKYALRANDLVFARKGSVDRSALVPNDGIGYFLGSDGICVRFDEEAIVPKYVLGYFQSETTRKYLVSQSYGTTMAGLNEGIMRNLQIVLPPRAEQERIAEALSDVDALLSAMTTMIEKKRAIKQGAMQQLLTDKKRLAGFTGPWVEKRLGEIADFMTATTPTTDIDLKWYIGTENMLADKAGVIQNAAAVPYKAVREYIKGDVLTSNIRPYLKKIWLADRDGGCSTDVLVIRTRDHSVCIPEFLVMLISDDSFFDFAMANVVGTKMPRGDKKVLVNFEVKLPTIAEQQAIAAVLSDMDAEIAALEAKRAKYESIKQGMMQELLTGKTRLV